MECTNKPSSQAPPHNWPTLFPERFRLNHLGLASAEQTLSHTRLRLNKGFAAMVLDLTCNCKLQTLTRTWTTRLQWVEHNEGCLSTYKQRSLVRRQFQPK